MKTHTNSYIYNSSYFQPDRILESNSTEPHVQSARILVKRSIQQAYFEQFDINKPNKQVQNYYITDSQNLRCFQNQRNYEKINILVGDFSSSNGQTQIDKYDKIILKQSKMMNKYNPNATQSCDSKLQASPKIQTNHPGNQNVKTLQTNNQEQQHEKISKQLYYVTCRNSFSRQKSVQQSDSHSSRIKDNSQQSQFLNKNKTVYTEFFQNKKLSDSKQIKHSNEGNQCKSLTKILQMFGGQVGGENMPQCEEYNLLQSNYNPKRTLEFEKINYGKTNKFKFKENISRPVNRINKKSTAIQSHRSFSQTSTQINFYDNNRRKAPQLISKCKNNRIIQFPVQTLKQLISHRKYEESLSSHLQCNQNLQNQHDLIQRKLSTPFKAEFDKIGNKFTIKDQSDLMNSTHQISKNNNKFVKLEDLRPRLNKQSSLCTIMNSANSNKQQNPVSNISIAFCKQSAESSLMNTAHQIQKPPIQLNKFFSSQSKKMIEDEFAQILEHTKIEDEKQELILNTIKNRDKISNIIRLIEESPLDCFQGDNNLLLKEIHSEFTPKQKFIAKQESDEKSIYPNEQSPTSNQTNSQQKQFMLNILDESYMKFTQQVQKETTQYIISKDKLLDFELFRSQKERKNLTKKQHISNLIKILHYIKDLKLTPKEIYKNNVFSSKPFEKQYSYEFITGAKHNNLLLCDFLITKNKYLVYDFDYVDLNILLILQKFYLTALHWASKRGHLKLAQFLISKGADVNATDILGKTPLYYACQGNHIELVEVKLFAKKCKFNGQFIKNQFLLYYKAYPWSNKYISYDQFVKNNPQLSNALFKARKVILFIFCEALQNQYLFKNKKIYSLMKMIPFKQRNVIWQQQLFNFYSTQS